MQETGRKLRRAMRGPALTLAVIAVGLFFTVRANSQENVEYVWETDQQVLEKLDRWRDLKFGVLFHWGIYAVPGVVESWSVEKGDVQWYRRPADSSYDEYRKWYYQLDKCFYPRNFDPDKWADIMADAGMKYMIFTSKHHDGFCMYDSKYSDFKVTNSLFKTHPKSNIGLHVMEAFRNKGLWAGWYFSAIDWSSEWFWNPFFPCGTAGPNYDVARHPQWWRNYLDFVVNQMDELTTDYGNVDLIWIDVTRDVPGEMYGLDDVLVKARGRNPGMLCVERSGGGKNENYKTPELEIPPTQLDYPWESCIMLTNYWSWHPVQTYKSARTVLDMLVEITAKGGSLVLGVGPTADGDIEDEAVEILHEIGRWLSVNGRALYGTRSAKLYNDGKTWFTASKDGKTLYAIYSLKDGDNLPAVIEWTGNIPTGKMILLKTGKAVKYKVDGEKVSVALPSGLAQESVAFEFTIAP